VGDRPETAPGRDTGSRAPERVGLWLVGARGSIATTVAYGVAGIARGLAPSTGLPTSAPPLDRLDLVGVDRLVLGGHDVCQRDVSASAGELVAAGVLPADLVAAVRDDAARFEAALRPGVLDSADTGFPDLDPRAAALGSLPPREQVAAIRADLDAFEAAHGLARTVVVFVASVEAAVSHRPEWGDLDAFESALDAGRSQPASMVYAYAALDSGRAFVNFTPSIGANVPALRALGEARGAPIAGSDGKTGETLVKTVLAPLFRARALKVLAWQGYNMLGNRDGEALRDPAHSVSKLRSKDEALRAILGDGGDGTPHTQVAIDFVPSLGDWKTAMDYVHFEGFLGTRMSMQFTWSGCDSALAAPLVIDLARLAELAVRRGEGGVLQHLACYFKSPMGEAPHDFHRQIALLEAYADAASGH